VTDVACKHCATSNEPGALFCQNDDCGRLLASRLVRAPWTEAMPDECAICVDEFRDGALVTFLPCMHCFHSHCAVRWLNEDQSAHQQCPVCNEPLELSTFSVV
jgi:hypothetical protein